MKSRKNVVVSSVLALSLGVSGIASANPVAIAKVIPFAEDSNATAAVKAECQLGEKVSLFTAKYGKKMITVSDSIGEGKHIDMKITHVFAPAGGAFSGPKWLEVQGTLKDGTTDIASFRAKRFSGGGAFGAMKGTCAIIGRTTKAIGKDIAKWLKKPVDGAALGDAK